MARELVVAWVGRHQRSNWEDLCSQYRQRIGHFAPIRDLPVKAKRAGDERSQLKLDAVALRAAQPDPCLIVALDRRGKQLSSVEFSRFLTETREAWPHSIAFFLGSDLGLAPEVLKEARIRLSLGPLTLPHELARLVLYEQIYRALSIEAGSGYHRHPLH